jgi:hypothetical protein
MTAASDSAALLRPPRQEVRLASPAVPATFDIEEKAA